MTNKGHCQAAPMGNPESHDPTRTPYEEPWGVVTATGLHQTIQVGSEHSQSPLLRIHRLYLEHTVTENIMLLLGTSCG